MLHEIHRRSPLFRIVRSADNPSWFEQHHAGSRRVDANPLAVDRNGVRSWINPGGELGDGVAVHPNRAFLDEGFTGSA